MAITLSEIREYRALATKYPEKRGSQIINHLLDELQSLRESNHLMQAALFGRKGGYEPLNGDNLMSFGKYKGEPLRNVPMDYLEWWLQKQDVGVLRLSAEFDKFPERGISIKKLKLWEYITERKERGNAIPGHQSENGA